jgi:multicomponent Na+:H+ antiporter subunit B
MNSLILRTATRFLVPLLLLFSLFLLLRGHDAPGGGFVGGLVAAAAFSLDFIARGASAARGALPADPRGLIGAGVLIALASGLPALLRGQPYLRGQWLTLPLPGLGPLALGTPLLFEAGVYLVVTGVAINIILSLGEA